jgi:23S rRNA pseudouridine1911/1915/1917 synthase
VTQGPDDDEAIADDDEFGNPQEKGEAIVCRIGAAEAGQRLDRALAALTGLSRSRVQALLEEGRVTGADGATADASRKVRADEAFIVTVPPPIDAVPRPQAIPIDVVYEDDELLVINKPPGMVVHPAAGNPDGTLVNALLAHCGGSLSGIGGVRRPGIVHRLDKDTSGLMVVAKTDRAHWGLTAQFADRSLSRTYQAVVWGSPSPAQGRIEGNIGRSPVDRKRMAVVETGGKTAATRYKRLESFGLGAALVECVLETGRTHQIRVHMAHIGHPLAGDPLYGGGRTSRARGANANALPEPSRARLLSFPRQALHAGALILIHPATGEAMRFEAPWPDDLRELVEVLRKG